MISALRSDNGDVHEKVVVLLINRYCFFDVLLAVAVVVNGAKQWRTAAAYLNLTCSKSSLSPLEFIQKQKLTNI